MAQLLWEPSHRRISEANITRFIQFVNKRHGLAIDDYHTLYAWSVTDIENFWGGTV